MKKEPAEATAKEPESKESWRKPLQVPPRANAMRSFYRGENESEETTVEADSATHSKPETPPREPAVIQNEVSARVTGKKQTSVSRSKKTETDVISKPKQAAQNHEPAKPEAESAQEEIVVESTAAVANAAKALTKNELSALLGFELEDLFDVHELLRGKSFELYRALWQASEGRGGRCKLTQPELMRRVEIKNRRTFYKHEDWLLKLRLLDKRHLPGDHKGVVYRVFSLSEALPLEGERIKQFENELKTTE